MASGLRVVVERVVGNRMYYPREFGRPARIEGEIPREYHARWEAVKTFKAVGLVRLG
jgi:hypothetical protein